MQKKRLLVFHKAIAPYRIDFFNSLNAAFDARICPTMDHMVSQTFDYERLKKFFEFTPLYLLERRNLWFGKIPKGIIRQIREWNPDIVLVNEFGSDAILAILYKWLTHRKYKVVSICDDSYNMVAENNDFKLSHKMARKVIVPLLDELILVEPQVVKWYQLYYGKGYWFPIIKRDDTAREMYQRLLPLSKSIQKQFVLENQFVFLFVGRLVNLKNVDTVIRAFAKIDQTSNCFIVIGDGPEKEKLILLAKELNANVVFTGRLEADELNLWYNIANIFILGSYQEPFGAVTNEALLAGCWCIISNKAGSRCLIQEGVNGFTFAPTDVDELADKLKLSIKILTEERRKERDSRMLESFEGSMAKLIDHLHNM